MKRSLLIISFLPVMALAAFLWLEWRLSDWSLPPLARGTLVQPSPFRARIVTRFPVGSPESAMTAELRKQGFQIDLYKRRCATSHPRLARSECYSVARLDRMTSPLTSIGWQVVWIAKKDVITEIQAAAGSDGP